VKRVFDLLIAVPGLIVLSPILLFIALAVRRKMGSPIIYTANRSGMHGRPIYLYKFRTMTCDVDADGNPLPDEDRLTSLGALLRKFSLDELPQLWNVVKGDISLVGPRPLLLEYNPLYNREQAKRLDAKPGITGWAQINGRNAISWEERFELDVWYVDNQSFWLDIKIIFMTFIKVIRPQGISTPGYVSCEYFKGSSKRA
jgi:sugar transferase EpsL